MVQYEVREPSATGKVLATVHAWSTEAAALQAAETLCGPGVRAGRQRETRQQ